MSTNVLEKYENLKTIENEMKFLTKSEIRLKILNCLNRSPYSIKEIVENTGLTYSSVSSNISKLFKNGNIYKEENKFKIDYISKIYLQNILDFNKTLKIIDNFEDFWNKHEINQINHDLLKNLNDLYKSQIIESTSIDIYKTHNTIKKHLILTDTVKAIFPYLHPDYPMIVENLIYKNCEIELIINKDIYNGLLGEINREKIKELVKNEKFRIHSVKNPINLYLTICDNHMSLGLFKNDGSFDQNRILISQNKKAIEWGEKLFETIKMNSTA